MGIFTSKAGRRGRAAADRTDSFKPILTPENSIVPGQMIVQLHADAAATVTSSIGTAAAPTSNVPTATSFGLAAVDKALAKIGVTAVTRLHPPAPPAFASMAADVAEPMGSTYRVYYSADIPAEKAVAALAGAEGVEMAEAVRYRETLGIPNDPQFPSQWGLTRVHGPQAWNRTTGNAAIVVAVVDTGVDLDHPELAPLIVPGRDLVNLGASPTPPPGFHFEGDFNTVDNDPMDEVGHGTHVAGTIACLSNNGVGVAGVTWQCRIMPVRVLARIVNNTNPSDVRGTGSSADIAAGIRWAVDHGARVINMSLGGPSDTFVERDAVAYAVAHGVVVCAAMGNGGLGAPTSFPAAYPDVVAVGAIDQLDHRASFSQVGPHIDVAGPGVGVLSTVWNNSYATMSGTSMATPHVAGVAALILSIKPSLTGAQCADILRQTADPLRDNPADPVPNNNYGWGCVNAFAAVNRASPPISLPVTCPLTRPIVCHPVSTLVRCPPVTRQIACPVTTPVTCLHPSQAILCQTSPVICHIQTSPIVCQVASATIICAPSASVGCPSIACHPGEGPGDPIFHPGALSAEDPYAPDYGNDSVE
jgi:subtilisin family serine protease